MSALGQQRDASSGKRGRRAKELSRSQLNKDNETLERLRQRVEERMEEDEVAEEVDQDARSSKRVKVDHPTSQGYSR